MRNSAFVLCVLLSPFVHCRPQYQSQDNIQNSQDYTDSPDAQLITYIAEKTGAVRQSPAAAPVFGPRSRGQTHYQVAAPQPQPIFSAQPPAPVQYTPSPSPPPQRPQSFQRLRPSALPQPQQPTQQEYATASPDEPRGRHQTTTYIPILRLDKSQSLDGSYKQSWETGNNIQAEETAFWKKIGAKEDQEALVQQGTYSYTAPDGTIIKTTYTADEGGFRVEGDHLPKPPPIPEEIQKGLAQIYEGIRLQQEADAREAKQGKVKGPSYYDQNSNAVTENYPQPTYQQPTYQQQQYLQLEADQNNPQQYQRQRFRQQ